MISQFIYLFALIPVLGYLASLIIPRNQEKSLSSIAMYTVAMQGILLLLFTGIWLSHGAPLWESHTWYFLQSEEYQFGLIFYFDRVGAVFGLVGAFLAFIVVKFSRVYLHREHGYKRFFNTVLFFFAGYSITIFAGNFETLFIGWEVLGISSFLLIAFYRERFLPVKNALKVFFIYRIADIGLLLAMWLSHHLWHENITFMKLHNQGIVHEHLMEHSLEAVCVSLLVLVAAYAKSAQLPFSSWLPRAMEGPTPSSAIFYGSLSVHLGVFLLLRIYPFMENQWSVRILVGVLGILGSWITMNIARVQSSVKSQIAYSSISQIGLIFVEIALGFTGLAIWHFAGNAFLRTYQLLVSPSLVTYRIREQIFNQDRPGIRWNNWLPKRWQLGIYVLSLKEWNLDDWNYKWLWRPLKKAGRLVSKWSHRRMLYVFLIFFAIGIYGLVQPLHLPASANHLLPILFAISGLVLVLWSFSEYRDVQLSWWLVGLNHGWIALAVSYNEHYKWYEAVWYLSGVVVCLFAGSYILKLLNRREERMNLFNFHGYVHKHRTLGFLFLICGLGVVGFPITPSFIGEDLIFSHIHESQWALASIVSVSLIIDGLAMMRIYARLFLGPYIDKEVTSLRAS